MALCTQSQERRLHQIADRIARSLLVPPPPPLVLSGHATSLTPY